MARRRNRRHRYESTSAARSPGRRFYSPSPTVSRYEIRSLPTWAVTSSNTRARARPSVLAPLSTLPLMRTVLRDTTFRRSSARRVPQPLAPGRRSPDLVARIPSLQTPFPKMPSRRDVVCARRGIRREVLFALGRGNGAGSKNRAKSNIRC